jgi:uncharacterized protein YbaP (TraB family)
MKTRKTILRGFILLLALCILPAGAQEKKAAASTRHTLWKVQGDHNVIYLLGSVHVLKKENYPLPSVIESAFTNSGIVAFETDVAALEDPAIAMKIMSKARLPEGETLQTTLSADTYKAFTNQVNESGMPAMMFEQFTPAMAAMTLEVLEMRKLDLDPEYGIDKHFFKLAGEANKQIVPLETVDFQINLLTGFSKEEGDALIKSMLKEIKNAEKDLGEMLKAWQTGDAGKLEKLLNEAKQDFPAIYKRLVTDRSRNWIPKIQEFAHGEKNAIVIVGAGHLVGKEGVVELLKQKGMKVTQE